MHASVAPDSSNDLVPLTAKPTATEELNADASSSTQTTLACLLGPLRQYINRLCSVFGTSFVIMLLSSSLLNSILFKFVTLGALPFYKTYIGVSGLQFQTYVTAAASPWGICTSRCV